MSTLNVDTWEPESGTAATLMATGDTVTVPSGASLVVASGATINITGATQTGFPSGGFNSVQVFTSSDTWTRPTDITKVIVEVLGGGSSGAASPSTDNCSGGGGGGYAKKFVNVSSVTASVITVGAGGTAVTAAPNVGIVGGASSWVDTASGGSLTLTGAGGAAPSNGSYAMDGTGGTGTNGDINIQGGDGFNSGNNIGKGGDSVFGFGGNQAVDGQAAAGAARGYGAGGGGGKNVSGGAGTGGIVIVWEYK